MIAGVELRRGHRIQIITVATSDRESVGTGSVRRVTIPVPVWLAECATLSAFVRNRPAEDSSRAVTRSRHPTCGRLNRNGARSGTHLAGQSSGLAEHMTLAAMNPILGGTHG